MHRRQNSVLQTDLFPPSVLLLGRHNYDIARILRSFGSSFLSKFDYCYLVAIYLAELTRKNVIKVFTGCSMDEYIYT